MFPSRRDNYDTADETKGSTDSPGTRIRRLLTVVGLSAIVTSIAFDSVARAQLLLGDINCDGAVTDADVEALVHALFNGSTCPQADVNGDGVISTGDFPLLLRQPITEPRATPTAIPFPSLTVVPTATVDLTETPIGPEITAFSVARADGTVTSPVGSDAEGRPIYERPLPQGFLLFLEVKRGPGNRPPGIVTFREVGAPDLQIVSSRSLGDGSPDVCDDGSSPDFIGGVPASPPTFTNVNAVNDLTCRFEHRTSSTACTFNGADFGFVDRSSTAQYCTTLGVGAEYAFPSDRTVLTGRVLDDLGQPSAPASIVIDVMQ